MNKKAPGLKDALLKPVNQAAIVILGAYTVLWGIWVALPFWNVFDSAPLFIPLSHAFPAEWMCGVLAIVCGLSMIYGAYKRTYAPLIIGSFIGTLFWFVIMLFYFVGDWHNTGGISALTFCLYAAYVHLNIKVNHKHTKNTMNEMVR